MAQDDRGDSDPKVGQGYGAERASTEALNFTEQLGEDILADLQRSGLQPESLRARALTESERAAANCGNSVRGYVIPYYGLNGDPLPFYRVRILNPEAEHGVRYKQPRKTSNHLYFPLSFRKCLESWCKLHSHLKMFIITEGEKKAACAIQAGFPAVALGGVDSWRSRTLLLPKDTELYSGKTTGKLRARLPSTGTVISETATLAQGLGDLIDLALQMQLTPIIIFDSDYEGTMKAEVQRAATMLAYEFRYLGLTSNKIKQIILPDLGSGKTGLDDLLTTGPTGQAWLFERIREVYEDRSAFPKHPNTRGFLNVQLENQQSRKDCQQVSAVVLTELDTRGMRLREEATGEPFYYDGRTHRLMPAIILDKDGKVMHKSTFGTLLYQEFGLSGNDKKVLTWLASQYGGEEPITSVTPRKVVALITEKEDPKNPDGIAFQAGDSQYFAISPSELEPVRLVDNGTYGILFEQGQVEPLDTERVLELFEEYNSHQRMPVWWVDTIVDTNIGKVFVDDDGGDIPESGTHMRLYAALLFYISPFLSRWKGLQLPVEITIGEAGSGKSSLYNLRLSILTGRPSLRNLPTDIRDWYSSITNAGGMHVIDNVHFGNKGLRQQMSDEICRLVTEPNPSIELRTLYTTSGQTKLPVSVTFAMTAIQMPFTNQDIMQRAAVFQTGSLGKPPDGDWVIRQLERHGGREAWVAHHLVFLHRFLKLAEKKWSPDFQTDHRLSHLEQCMTLAAQVLGIPTGFLSQTMKQLQSSSIEEADWTASGLKAYVDELRMHLTPHQIEKFRFSSAEIASWSEGHPEFGENHILVNPRKLGRYLMSHRTAAQKMFGIVQKGVQSNKVIYGLEPNWLMNPNEHFQA